MFCFYFSCIKIIKERTLLILMDTLFIIPHIVHPHFCPLKINWIGLDKNFILDKFTDGGGNVVIITSHNEITWHVGDY